MEITLAKTKRDLYLGLFCLVLGVAYILLIPHQVPNIKDFGLDNVSGRTLPYLAGSLATLLSSILIIRSIRTIVKLKGLGVIPADLGPVFGWKVWTYIAALVIYTLTMDKIGFVVTSSILLAFALWLTGSTNKLVNIICVLTVPAVTYYVFYHLMRIPFPVGWLI